jgi:hypothetical protein
LPFLFSVKANAQEIKAELNKEVKRQEKISYILDYPQNAKGNVPLLFFFMVPEKEEIIWSS